MYCEISTGLYTSFAVTGLIMILFTLVGLSLKNATSSNMIFAFIFSFVGLAVGLIAMPFLSTSLGCQAILVG